MKQRDSTVTAADKLTPRRSYTRAHLAHAQAYSCLVPSHKAGDETSCRGSVSSRFRSTVWLLETISSSLLHSICHFFWPKRCSGHGRYGRYASYATAMSYLPMYV